MTEVKASEGVRNAGLIVNADDWGLDRKTTIAIMECVQSGAVTSASAMVYMIGSSHAATLARQDNIATGLHLNLTTPFDDPRCPSRLVEAQRTLASFLRRHRLAQVLFHPGLTRTFAYVVEAQFREYERLYGQAPQRVDGHHHMHLCANVLAQKLIPAGTTVRRNLSLARGEKGTINRWYRIGLDHLLSRRHRLEDYLYNLNPVEPTARLLRISALAMRARVELETHPARPEEYHLMRSGRFAELVQSTGACIIDPRR